MHSPITMNGLFRIMEGFSFHLGKGNLDEKVSNLETIIFKKG